MCTVIIKRNPASPWPLMLAANRDEMNNRPANPPARHWPDRADVIAGRDELAGGTWLGLNEQGVVAAILNRIGTLGPAPDKRSRGELPLEALDHETAEAAAEALSHLNPKAYRPFNLVIADADHAYWLANTGDDLEFNKVPDGLHMVTAFDLNSPDSPRISHFLPLFQGSNTPDPDLDNWQSWQALLASRDHAPGTGEKGAMLVETDSGFGTVSSSLIALPAKQRFEAKPHWLYADGPPDRTPWLPVGLE